MKKSFLFLATALTSLVSLGAWAQFGGQQQGGLGQGGLGAGGLQTGTGTPQNNNAPGGGMTGMRFVQAPVPMDMNCSSVIVQGNTGFLHSYFVLPRGFLGIDRLGRNLIQIIPPTEQKQPISAENPAHIQFSLFFPKDVNEALAIRRTQGGNTYVHGCNFKKIEADLNKAYWQQLDPNSDDGKMYARIKERKKDERWFFQNWMTEPEVPLFKLLPGMPTMVQISFPTIPTLNNLPDGNMIGDKTTTVLGLYGFDHVVDIPVKDARTLKAFRDAFTKKDGLGVPVQLNIEFAANRANGEIECSFNTDSIEQSIRNSIKARGQMLPSFIDPTGAFDISKINLRMEMSKAIQNDGVRCSQDASTNDNFNAISMNIAQSMIQSMLPTMQMNMQNQMPFGGLPNTSPLGGSGGFTPLGSGFGNGGMTQPGQLEPCIDPQTGTPLTENEFSEKFGAQRKCQEIGSGLSADDKKISLDTLINTVKKKKGQTVKFASNALASKEVFTTYVSLKGELQKAWEDPAIVASTPRYQEVKIPYRTGIEMKSERSVKILPLSRVVQTYDYDGLPSTHYATRSEILTLSAQGVKFGQSVERAKESEIIPVELAGIPQERNGQDETTFPTFPVFAGANWASNFPPATLGRLAYVVVTRDATPREIKPWNLQKNPEQAIGPWKAASAKDTQLTVLDETRWNELLKAGKIAALGFSFRKGTDITKPDWLPGMLKNSYTPAAAAKMDYTIKKVTVGTEWGVEIKAKKGKDLGELIIYNLDEHNCLKMEAGECVPTWRQRVYAEWMSDRNSSIYPLKFERIHKADIVGVPPLNRAGYLGEYRDYGYLKSYDASNFLEYMPTSASVMKISLRADPLPGDEDAENGILTPQASVLMRNSSGTKDVVVAPVISVGSPFGAPNLNDPKTGLPQNGATDPLIVQPLVPGKPGGGLP